MNKGLVPMGYTHIEVVDSAIPGKFIKVYCKGDSFWWSRIHNKWLRW